MHKNRFKNDEILHKKLQQSDSANFTYRCSKCLKSFETKGNWYAHTLKCYWDTQNIQLYPCPECDLKLPSRNLLIKHIMSYCRRLAIYPCVKTYSRKAVNEKSENLFHCAECVKPFQNQIEWYRHSIECVKNKSDQTEYPCPQCGLIFIGKHILNMHMLSYCKQTQDKQKLPWGFEGEDVPYNKKFKYQCPCCQKMFFTDKEIDVNDKKNSLLPNLHCSGCGSQFSAKEFLGIQPPVLQDGVLTRWPKKRFKYNCTRCHKIFCTKRKIDTNPTKNGRLPIVQCNRCGKGFTAYDLQLLPEEEKNAAPDMVDNVTTEATPAMEENVTTEAASDVVENVTTEAAVDLSSGEDEEDNLVEIIELNEEEVDCFAFNSDICVKNEIQNSEVIDQTEIVKIEIKEEPQDIFVKNEPLVIKEEPHETDSVVETCLSPIGFEVKTESFDYTEFSLESPKVEVEVVECTSLQL